jgi:hypothetical protein
MISFARPPLGRHHEIDVAPAKADELMIRGASRVEAHVQ